MSRSSRKKVEESYFAIISGVATKKDFENILSQKTNFISPNRYIFKSLNYILTNQEILIERNLKFIKNDLDYINKLFESHNKSIVNIIEVKCSYKDLITSIENYIKSNQSEQTEEFIDDIKGKITYVQKEKSIQNNHEVFHLKLIFYLLVINLIKNDSKFELYKNELKFCFIHLFENQANIYERMVYFAKIIKEQLKINIKFLFNQLPKDNNIEIDKIFLFYSQILYYIQEIEKFNSFEITKIIKEEYFENEKYYPGLIILFNYLCSYPKNDIKNFNLNFFNIMLKSVWLNPSNNKSRTVPTQIERNLVKLYFDTINKKQFSYKDLFNLLLLCLEKYISVSLVLLNIAENNEQLVTIYSTIHENLYSLSKETNFSFRYQICYFFMRYKNYIEEENLKKLNKIELSQNKTSELIDIHFIFSFLHRDVQHLILSSKEKANSLNEAFNKIKQNNSSRIDPFQIINYELMNGNDCFEKEQNFFLQYTKNDIINRIPFDKNQSGNDKWIALFQEHFDKTIKQFKRLPYIIYHNFNLKTKTFNSDLFSNIYEIKIDKQILYKLKGIIISKDVYIYNNRKNQLFCIQQNEWINLEQFKVPKKNIICLVYFKVSDEERKEKEIMEHLPKNGEKVFDGFQKEDQQKIWKSFLWMLNNVINFVIKRESVFIESFNLIEADKIKEIYEMYEKNKNKNIKNFCISLIQNYKKKHNKINEIIKTLEKKSALCAPENIYDLLNIYLENSCNEKEILEFIENYYNQLDKISIAHCKAVTLITSLILCKFHPNKKDLLTLVIQQSEEETKYKKIIALVNKLNKNIDKNQFEKSVLNYWENNNSQNLFEQLKCKLMLLITSDLTQLVENFKNFIEKNSFIFDQNFIQILDFIFIHIYNTYYKSNNILFSDLISIFCESSPIFTSEGKVTISDIEWRIFNFYINNILINEEDKIKKVNNIIINLVNSYESNQTALLYYIYSLGKRNIILHKDIRETIINWINNKCLNQELKFMIIYSFNMSQIEQKITEIKTCVSKIGKAFNSKWTAGDIYYMFISLYYESSTIKLSKKDFDEKIVDKNTNTNNFCFDEKKPHLLFPSIDNVNNKVKEILNNRTNNILSVVFQNSKENDNKLLGDIVFYIPNSNKYENKISFQNKSYNLKGLIIFNKKLNDILLINEYSKYYYSLCNNCWSFTLSDKYKSKIQKLISVYTLENDQQSKDFFSYSEIDCNSDFSKINDKYLSEIYWLIKNDFHSLEKNSSLFEKVFKIKANLSKIKEMKEKYSLSKEEFNLFMKLYESLK